MTTVVILRSEAQFRATKDLPSSGAPQSGPRSGVRWCHPGGQVLRSLRSLRMTTVLSTTLQEACNP
jgi:hypothetical protein